LYYRATCTLVYAAMLLIKCYILSCWSQQSYLRLLCSKHVMFKEETVNFSLSCYPENRIEWNSFQVTFTTFQVHKQVTPFQTSHSKLTHNLVIIVMWAVQPRNKWLLFVLEILHVADVGILRALDLEEAERWITSGAVDFPIRTSCDPWWEWTDDETTWIQIYSLIHHLSENNMKRKTSIYTRWSRVY